MEDRPGDPPPWCMAVVRVYGFIVLARDTVLFAGVVAYAVAALVVGRTTAAHVIGLVLLVGCSIVGLLVIRRRFANLC